MIATGGASLNIANGIREFGHSTPAETAVICRDRTLTFAQLDERSSRLANALLTAGLRPGERVAVLLSNRLEYPEVLCGISKAGLVVVPVNTRLAAREIGYILGHSSAVGLITEEAFSDVAGDALGEHNVANVLSLEGCTVGRDYDRALNDARPVDPKVPVSETDSFMISYTSGTTGRPKGAMLSHRSRCLTFLGVAVEWGLRPGRRSAVVSPMYFGGGFAYGYGALHVGSTIAILPAYDPEELVATIQNVGVQTMFLVPTHAQRLRALGDEWLLKFNMSSLETLYFAGAPMPQDLKEWLVNVLPHVGTHDHYGSTEAGIVTNLRPKDLLRKPRSVGVPWLMNEVRVVGDDGTPVPPGGTGEVFSRSPYLMTGYLDDSEATAACTTEDGFLTSGDVAAIDEDGYLYIVDRKKDMIITGGANVYSLEIEEALRSHPTIEDVAVVGLPDFEWGELVTAVVVTKGGAGVDATELDAFLRRSLGRHKIPKRYERVAELPRNPSGKVLKRELRDRYSSPGRT